MLRDFQTALAGGELQPTVTPSPACPAICFEPPLALARDPELWVIAAGDRATWDGATVAWSEDGDWYPENAEGAIGAHAVVGTLLDPLPWTTSYGSTTAFRVACRFLGVLRAGDAGSLVRQQTLCYVGDGRNAFELVCYSSVHLVALEGDAHIHAFTGPLRRGCYGTPILAHAPGAQFARLDAQVARISLPTRLLTPPATIRLRVVSACGGDAETGHEDPSDVEPITYPIHGPCADPPIRGFRRLRHDHQQDAY